MSDLQPRHNADESRFEVTLEGHTGVIDYRRHDEAVLDYYHTGVPSEIEGRGVASALARFALDWARDHGVSVLPRCPFLHAYIKRHPEYLELVPDHYSRRDDLEGR